jgi:hypothetical protein
VSAQAPLSFVSCSEKLPALSCLLISEKETEEDNVATIADLRETLLDLKDLLLKTI